MPWTETTCPDYDRRELRYASDLHDHEWTVIALFMPEPNRIGRPRKTVLREVVNAIFYIAVTHYCPGKRKYVESPLHIH